MRRKYLKEVFELQRVAGIKEMDTQADAEREDYINGLLDRIEKDVRELQEILEDENGPAPVSYVLKMVNQRLVR